MKNTHLQELIAKKKELDKLIEKTRQEEADEALKRVINLVETFGFTMQEIFPLQSGKKKNKDNEPKDTEPAVIYSQPIDPKNPFPIQ